MPRSSGDQTGEGGKQPRALLDEINEKVIQRLFATGLMTSSLEDHVTDPFVRNRIREIVESLDKVIADVRLMVLDSLSKIEK